MDPKTLPKTEFYDTVEFLGEGLNSCVYRGFRKTHQNLPAQEVAVKVFKHSDEVLEFERRFQKLVTVRSRYCVGLLGWEEINGQVAIIMDYVRGLPLNQFVDNVSLSQAQKQEILAQLQIAIYELHGFGVVHGDLSAANIMINEAGQLILIDYGFGQTNQDQDLVGSPRFMSPERWQGQAPDIASDIFSFGLIAYDLEHGTMNQRDSNQKLKERAQHLGRSTEIGAFSSNARNRRMEPIFEENPVIRRELSVLVQRLLGIKLKVESTLATRIFQTTTVVVRKVRGHLKLKNYAQKILTVVFIAVLFPTLSGGDVSVKVPLQPLATASIEFRTLHWFDIKINGQKIGFTPLRMNALTPGTYAIKWKSSKRYGVKTITLTPGEKALIRDADLFSKH